MKDLFLSLELKAMIAWLFLSDVRHGCASIYDLDHYDHASASLQIFNGSIYDFDH
jgi:hypothetical protein